MIKLNLIFSKNNSTTWLVWEKEGRENWVRLSSRVHKMFSHQIGEIIVGGISAQVKCTINKPHISVFHPLFYLSTFLSFLICFPRLFLSQHPNKPYYLFLLAFFFIILFKAFEIEVTSLLQHVTHVCMNKGKKDTQSFK